MKKYIHRVISVMMVCIMVLALAGCGEVNKEIAFNPKTSSVYVCDDGTFLCATVEDFSESYYNVKELKNFVEEKVIDYNEVKAGVPSAYNVEESEASTEAEKLPIAIKDCYVSDKDVVLILACQDYSDFYKINSLDEYKDVITSLKKTTIAEMKQNGQTFLKDLMGRNGSSVSVSKIMKKKKYHVVTGSGSGTIYVQGIIQYASSGIIVNDEGTAATVTGEDFVIVYK
ncbi:MAG: hypothetical protein IJM37_07585 [Lachnospiraceae bacterium]|nr:hypothetical protein [Lachnospiraceae bacterium]